MRFLIVGAGAVGGYFGARLLQSGADVTFLVRPTSADRLRREGLTIRSDLGDTQSAVATVTSDQAPAPHQGQSSFDVILLACKAYHLAEVIDDIRPWVAADTAVLPLLNGLRHLDRLRDAFGSEQVLGGCCHIGVTRGAAGVIQHLNRLHSITFGELSGQTTMRLGRLADALGRTTLDAHPSDRILQEMWNKLVMLATFAGITCLMRAPIGVINACAEGSGLITALLEECETIATAAGFPPALAMVSPSFDHFRRALRADDHAPRPAGRRPWPHDARRPSQRPHLTRNVEQAGDAGDLRGHHLPDARAHRRDQFLRRGNRADHRTARGMRDHRIPRAVG